MTEQARSDRPQQSGGGDSITVELPREEVEALLLAVDALQPLLARIRAQIAPVPAAAPATATPVASAGDDALQRVTRLAGSPSRRRDSSSASAGSPPSSAGRGRRQPDATGRPLGARS